MSPRIQLFAIWTIVPFAIIFLVSFWAIAGFIPPSSPAMSPEQLFTFYDENRIAIRVGQLICLLSSAFFFILPATISAQMARIEAPRFPILAVVQYVTAAVLALLFMLCSLIWTIAAYRPEMNPEMLQLVHDSGWLIFVMAYPEYIAQLGCIVIVGFADRREQPFLPRWACYLTMFAMITGGGGIFATFFKTGPFAWNGVFGFWMPMITFMLWMLVVILPCTHRAVMRQMREEDENSAL